MQPHVVVVGAGFAGVWAVRRLAKRGVARITLVEQNNYHTFYPLLYQVAAAELGPTSVAYPVRSLLRGLHKVRFKLGRLESVDVEAKSVVVEGEVIDYDALLLATGSVPNFFGVEGAESFAFRLRELSDALPLRQQVLAQFEVAAQVPPGPGRTEALSFVIVGGGATGVEFAGALSELIYGPLLRDFPEIGADEVSITLVEGGARLLASMHESSSAYAASRLTARKVDLRMGQIVQRVTADGVEFKDGSGLVANTVVWTAGIQGDPLFRDGGGLEVGAGGRIKVDPTLQARGAPDVFIAGDLALAEHDGAVLPQVAPVAIQQGEAAAENIARRLAHQTPIPFVYDDPGMLAVIGRYAAVAEVGGYRGKGIVAWAVWALVHIRALVGFRNRFLVMVNWAWNYLSFSRAVRLILPERDEKR
ncbi:MAG: NAD(P)/FAD-dependent oxidoreductase [Longimicrobiales bacterium]